MGGSDVSENLFPIRMLFTKSFDQLNRLNGHCLAILGYLVYAVISCGIIGDKIYFNTQTFEKITQTFYSCGNRACEL